MEPLNATASGNNQSAVTVKLHVADIREDVYQSVDAKTGVQGAIAQVTHDSKIAANQDPSQRVVDRGVCVFLVA